MNTKQKKIENCWITVNKTCNLKCQWCYLNHSVESSSNDLKLEDAYRLADMVKELGVKAVTITGGEPLCYNGLLSLVSYLKKKEVSISLNTNGIGLSKRSIVHKLKKCGLDYINISLKGWNEASYYTNTTKFGFEKVLCAVRNVRAEKLGLIISIVLTDNMVYNLIELVKEMILKGGSFFYFSFDYSIDNLKNIKHYIKTIEQFQRCYEQLNIITQGKFILHTVFPLCIFQQEFIEHLIYRNQLICGCQLLNESGLIFDNNANLIPCNALPDVNMGVYKKDFDESDTLKKHINSRRIRNFYKRINGVPSIRCLKCYLYNKCRGGCLMQWLVYDYTTLMSICSHST